MIKRRSMGYFLSAICWFLPLSGLADNNNTCVNSNIQEVVTHYIQPLVTNQVIPSAEVGVYENGVICYFSFGKTLIGGTQDAPNQHSIFEIGSITKTLTATLLALAQNDNLLNMNSSIVNKKTLPPWMTINPKADDVTYAQLANFSSGMPRMPSNLNTHIENPMLRIGFNQYSLGDFRDFISAWYPKVPLPAPNLYSNASFALLGYIVTYAFGYNNNYEALVLQAITRPLGMTDTVITIGDTRIQRLVQGYNVDAKQTSGKQFVTVPSWPRSVFDAAGNFRSTAYDMVLYIEANLGVLKEKNDPVLKQLTAAMQLTHQPIYYFHDGHTGQGLAWLSIPGDDSQDHLTWKNGATAGFTSFIGLDPSKKLGICILTNAGSLKSFALSNNITSQGLQILKNIQ